MGKYNLKCLKCGKEYKKHRMSCDNGCDSLLRTQYETKNFSPGQEKNIFKFFDWLPCQNKVNTTIGPVVYKCENFGKKLGLKNLYCSFNGYWPKRGALNMTGTFKDYEALPTLINLIDNRKKAVVVSSAGNTARAFAYAAAQMDFDTYIVIPGKMFSQMWLPSKRSMGRIHIIVVKDSRDYYRAIKMANKIASDYHIPPEGGAKNIARRDGMGTVMLEAARVIGKLPDHYFQAVGSGTGAIAAYEASLRLLEDKKFRGQNVPRLNLVQNAPFTPIYEAWHKKKPIQPDQNIEIQLEKISKMHANILANRNPPYYIKGGVFDALEKSKGVVYKATNQEAIAASIQFEEKEGIDIDPAASVCAAALIKAAKKGLVHQEETILINITGGGLKKLKQDYDCCLLEPEIFIENESQLDLNNLK